MIETFRSHHIEDYFRTNLGLQIRHVELDRNTLAILYQQNVVFGETLQVRNRVDFNEEVSQENYLYGLALMFSHFLLEHQLPGSPVIELSSEAEAVGVRLPELLREQRRQADILARSILKGNIKKNFKVVWESIDCEIFDPQMIGDIRDESVYFSRLLLNSD